MKILHGKSHLAKRSSILANMSIRVWIQAVIGKLKNKPLLDLVGGVVEDYEFLWDQYYFSTATM
jgi:peroxin-16